MMIVVKSSLHVLPEYCDDCIYYECRPHPYKGWTQCCNLCCHSMDDDVEDEWIYDGYGRPKKCPLIEVPDIRTEEQDAAAYQRGYEDGFREGRTRKELIDALDDDLK